MNSVENSDRELLYTPAHLLVGLIRAKKLSPVELVEATLRRIDSLDTEISSYITVDSDRALKTARMRADDVAKGVDFGPLHGIPVSIKDTIATEGLRTTSGSTILKDFVPDNDELAVSRLRADGAIVIGKTNVPEFANAFSGENELTAPCRNPWSLDRSCNGSSSGAAASVAAGMGPIALGTDGGGSIRAPAGACGVYGLKPTTTKTRIPFAPDPRTGRAMNFVTHGPITRNVTDAALAMNTLSGPAPGMYNCMRSEAPDFLEAVVGDPTPFRIAWSSDLGYVARDYGIDAEYLSVVESAVRSFERMGHHLEPATPRTGNPIRSWERVVYSQVLEGLGPIYDEHANEMAPYNRRFVRHARALSGVDVATAFQDMQRWQAELDEFFEKYDLLITPILAGPPQSIGAVYDQLSPAGNVFQYEYCPFTQLFNLTRNPAASLPCGFTSEGLPVGMQVVARPGDEFRIIQVSRWFERSNPWQDKLPKIS